MRQQARAHLSLVTAGLLFGANYAIAKGLMPDHFSPMQIIFVRITGATVLFWALSMMLPPVRVERKDLVRIAIAALFGISINQVMFFVGLNFTTPVNAAVIHASSPLYVLIFAALVLKERITGLKAAGILVGGLGALGMIAVQQGIEANTLLLKGNLFILINIIAYALYIVLIKPVLEKYPPVTVMKWAFLFGWIYVVPFSLGETLSMETSGIPVIIWLSLLYVVVGTTFLAYLLTLFGLKHLEASVVGYYIYMQPVIASAIAWVMFREPLTPEKVAGALLIFTGVFLVTRHQGIRLNRRTQP